MSKAILNVKQVSKKSGNCINVDFQSIESFKVYQSDKSRCDFVCCLVSLLMGKPRLAMGQRVSPAYFQDSSPPLYLSVRPRLSVEIDVIANKGVEGKKMEDEDKEMCRNW